MSDSETPPAEPQPDPEPEPEPAPAPEATTEEAPEVEDVPFEGDPNDFGRVDDDGNPVVRLVRADDESTA